MSKFVASVKKFITKYITRKEEAATLAEYGLLLALIAVACMTAISTLGSSIKAMFTTIANTI